MKRDIIYRAGLPAAAILLSMSVAVAQSRGTLRALLIEYRCAVVDRLERIYEHGDPSQHRDRFLAVTQPAHPHAYVQCMFFDDRSRILCEASSGYYYDPPDQPRTFWLQADAIAALSRLGFSTDDSKGNFRLELSLRIPPDFNALADLMLKALHDAYDARADSDLRFNAPFARRANSSCVPVS